eukprot:1153945-Pelagomonas_calceolata.AAC.1
MSHEDELAVGGRILNAKKEHVWAHAQIDPAYVVLLVLQIGPPDKLSQKKDPNASQCYAVQTTECISFRLLGNASDKENPWSRGRTTIEGAE